MNHLIDRSLQIFFTAVQAGSFNKAAAELYTTTAGVMRHVDKVEARLGVKLLRRGPKGIALTQEGRRLYEQGLKLLQQADKLEQELTGITSDEPVNLRIGSSFLNPGTALIRLWHELVEEESPSFKFSLVPFEDTRLDLPKVAAELGTRFDVIYGSFNSQSVSAHSSFFKCGQSRFCVAMPKGHPLSAKAQVSLSDLEGYHLLTVKRGDAEPVDRLTHLIESEHPGIILEEPNFFYDLDTFNLCEEKGWLLLTLDVWAGVHPSLITLPLVEEGFVSLGVLYAKDPSPVVRRFVDMLGQALAQRGPGRGG